MTQSNQRAAIYIAISVLTVLQQGIKANMTYLDMWQLFIGVVLAGLVTYRAFLDQGKNPEPNQNATPTEAAHS